MQGETGWDACVWVWVCVGLCVSCARLADGDGAGVSKHHLDSGGGDRGEVEGAQLALEGQEDVLVARLRRREGGRGAKGQLGVRNDEWKRRRRGRITHATAERAHAIM